MKRTAITHWEIDFKGENFDVNNEHFIHSKMHYSFLERYEEAARAKGDLIAAAHAGCFTMAVDLQLTERGLKPEMLETRAIVDLDVAALKIYGIHLELKGKVTGLAEEAFQIIAKNARETCILSKALIVPITLNASLEI